MILRPFFVCLCLLLACPVWAQSPVPPRETPPAFAAFAQVETHRIRIVNTVDGAIQVSTDRGKTWRLVGRVTAPATESLSGYLASGYAKPSTIAATAVHGLRIRVGDLTSAYPKLINILPREFAQTPHYFGGHISGASGIYTNIPVGVSIFRELAPLAGNPVFLQSASGSLSPLELNYAPRADDVFVITVLAPANPLREVDFENKAGGAVTAHFVDGATKIITSVVKPVQGVGRYDGCSYTGVGAINTNHCGVITVSTAPVSPSPLFEGTGDERRGGFQIQPAFHNSRDDTAGAPSILVVGTRKRPVGPELEGTPPLFDGYFDLAWDAADPAHSWRAEVQRGADRWQPMPTLIGNLPNVLEGITGIRLVRDDPGDHAWREARVASAAQGYKAAALAEAKTGKTPIERGRITINTVALDPRITYVVFYVDGAFKGVTNARPFGFSWDTTSTPDGEYVLEAVAQDENNVPLSSTRTKVWVDNTHQAAQR